MHTWLRPCARVEAIFNILDVSSILYIYVQYVCVCACVYNVCYVVCIYICVRFMFINSERIMVSEAACVCVCVCVCVRARAPSGYVLIKSCSPYLSEIWPVDSCFGSLTLMFNPCGCQRLP
jgi:hypothetical protein